MAVAGESGAGNGRTPPSFMRQLAIVAVKLVHSAIFLAVAASVLFVFYAGVTNRRSWLSRVAVAIALGESFIFTVNRFQCPLRGLTEDLGAPSGQITDIFLPRWFADRIPYFFTPPLVIGVATMLWPGRQDGTSEQGSAARYPA
jgi:hypothetical protein